MKLGALIIFSMLLCAGAALAQSPEKGSKTKAAWEWTLEERLAERLNPQAMKARAAAELARIEASGNTVEDDDPLFAGVYPSELSVDGSRNPELLLPHELFDHLVNTCFPPDGMDQEFLRSLIEPRAAALGLGDGLWERLENDIQPMLAYDRERHDRAMEAVRNGRKPSEEGGFPRCRLRAVAMASVKRDLGEALFLRLLYEAVAPTTSITYSSAESLADDLRFQERGCQ